MRELNEMIKIADIHADRIKIAVKHITHLFPMKAETIQNLKEDDLAWVDLLINRFGKLQDFIGSKIVDAFLELNEEDISNLTMLDKLHKLEKLGIIEDSEIWKEMRKTRNHIAHEYPDQPDVMARYINQVFDFVPYLFRIFNNIKVRLELK